MSLSSLTHSLQDFLRTRWNISDEDTDIGVRALIWPRPATGRPFPDVPHFERRGEGDGSSAAEVFQEALRLLDQIRFRGPMGRETPPRQSGLFNLFRGHPSLIPPWLMDDGNPRTLEDRRARLLLERAVHRTASPNREAQATSLMRTLHEEKNRGGLEILYEFAEDGSHRRRDGLEAMRAGEGDCNALSFIYYAMAARAGLNPQFIRITAERNPLTGAMQSLPHIGVAIAPDPLHPERLMPLDPSRNLVIEGDTWQWYPVSRNEMLAFHLRNLAYFNVPENLSGESALAWREDLLQQAFELAPYNFEIALDIGRFYQDMRRDTSRARFFLERASEINPEFSQIWSGLQTHP